MAGRDVNVFFSNWRATGTNVSTPQYAIDVTLNWTDANGSPRTATRTVLFPNLLAQLPAAWVADEMKDLILRAARKYAGIDD